MYKVIYKFADMKDGNHVYNVGDTYPRNNVDVNVERVKELASKNNRIGMILIEEIKEKPVRKAVAEEEQEPTAEKPKPNRRKKAEVEAE